MSKNYLYIENNFIQPIFIFMNYLPLYLMDQRIIGRSKIITKLKNDPEGIYYALSSFSTKFPLK